VPRTKSLTFCPRFHRKANAFKEWASTSWYEKKRKARTYTIDLGGNEAVVVKVLPKFLNIHIRNPTDESFEHSVGLMGDYKSGKLVDRNGNEMEDFSKFGQEWQVNADDRSLFSSFAIPQFPEKCIPAKNVDLFLNNGRGISEGQAREACATRASILKGFTNEDLKDCILDVLATGDLNVAREI
jgi:hypothetical protein